MRAGHPGFGLLTIILLLAAVYQLPAEIEHAPQPRSDDFSMSDGLVAEALAVSNLTGTARDLSKAVKLLEEAAALNDSRAQYYLGLCCYNGEGVVKNYRKSCFWFMLAVENNHASASLSLEQCLSKLSEDDAVLVSQQVQMWRKTHEKQ